MDVTLREYLESRWLAHDREHAALAESIKVARMVVDARLERLNELRSEVIEDRGEFIRRDIFDARVGIIENWKSKATGVGLVIVVIAGTIGALVSRAIGH